MTRPKPWGRMEAVKVAASQGNASPHYFFFFFGHGWRRYMEAGDKMGARIFLLKTERGRERGRDRLERQK